MNEGEDADCGKHDLNQCSRIAGNPVLTVLQEPFCEVIEVVA